MDRALLITWYDLPEGKEAEHLSWVKERYMPRMLLSAMGVELLNSTPEQFAAVITDDTVRWAKVIKAAGITPQ